MKKIEPPKSSPLDVIYLLLHFVPNSSSSFPLQTRKQNIKKQGVIKATLKS